MQKASALTAITIAFVIVTVPFGDTIAFAQAGATGGTISKQNKSASGDDEGTRAIKPRQTAKPRSAAAELDDGERKPNSKCPNIAGVWNSWASGIWGKGDTTFKADGMASHRSGFTGKWFCEKGQLRIEWSDGAPGAVKLSADRKQIISDGGIHMSRD